MNKFKQFLKLLSLMSIFCVITQNAQGMLTGRFSQFKGFQGNPQFQTTQTFQFAVLSKLPYSTNSFSPIKSAATFNSFYNQNNQPQKNLLNNFNLIPSIIKRRYSSENNNQLRCKNIQESLKKNTAIWETSLAEEIANNIEKVTSHDIYNIQPILKNPDARYTIMKAAATKLDKINNSILFHLVKHADKEDIALLVKGVHSQPHALNKLPLDLIERLDQKQVNSIAEKVTKNYTPGYDTYKIFRMLLERADIEPACTLAKTICSFPFDQLSYIINQCNQEAANILAQVAPGNINQKNIDQIAEKCDEEHRTFLLNKANSILIKNN